MVIKVTITPFHLVPCNNYNASYAAFFYKAMITPTPCKRCSTPPLSLASVANTENPRFPGLTNVTVDISDKYLLVTVHISLP